MSILNISSIAGVVNSGVTDNVYSEEETPIGTWIDGRTIYRKVIKAKTVNSELKALTISDVSQLNIGFIINLYGQILYDELEESLVSYPINFSEADNSVVTVWYERGEIKMRTNTGAYTRLPIIIIIEYVKRNT